MSPALDRRVLASIAAFLAIVLASSHESRAGIVLGGGSLIRNGDPVYIYALTASLTGDTTFQQGDSFSILGMIGVGKQGIVPPLHFEPSDDGSLPTYAFSYKADAPQPLPAPFPQNVTYLTSDVTWTNSSGPTVPAGSTLGLFGVLTIELPELYPTITSITLPWTAITDGGTSHESGYVTFYLATPEPSSLTIAAVMGVMSLIGVGVSRRHRGG